MPRRKKSESPNASPVLSELKEALWLGLLNSPADLSSAFDPRGTLVRDEVNEPLVEIERITRLLSAALDVYAHLAALLDVKDRRALVTLDRITQGLTPSSLEGVLGQLDFVHARILEALFVALAKGGFLMPPHIVKAYLGVYEDSSFIDGDDDDYEDDDYEDDDYEDDEDEDDDLLDEYDEDRPFLGFKNYGGLAEYIMSSLVLTDDTARSEAAFEKFAKKHDPNEVCAALLLASTLALSAAVQSLARACSAYGQYSALYRKLPPYDSPDYMESFTRSVSLHSAVMTQLEFAAINIGSFVTTTLIFCTSPYVQALEPGAFAKLKRSRGTNLYFDPLLMIRDAYIDAKLLVEPSPEFVGYFNLSNRPKRNAILGRMIAETPDPTPPRVGPGMGPGKGRVDVDIRDSDNAPIDWDELLGPAQEKPPKPPKPPGKGGKGGKGGDKT